MFNNYGHLSSLVYDKTKKIGSSIDGDLEYYMDRLEGVNGDILEAGVGNGRLMIPLLEKGLKIHGLDYSDSMLKICKENLKKHKLDGNLYKMDLLDMDFKDKFDAIIMPTGSFLLVDQAELLLNNFFKALAPGGKLIFDIYFPHDFKANSSQNFFIEINNEESIFYEIKNLSLDWVKSRTQSIIKYELWKNSKLMDSELQDFSMNFYSLKEISYILESSGFKDIKFSANYLYNCPPKNNKDIISIEAYK